MHETVFKMVLNQVTQEVAVSYFKEVARLAEGGSFGELALLNNKARAATVICTRNTRFATLARKDFRVTVGQEERRKLKESVAMMRKFRIFASKSLKDKTVEKVFKYMTM